MRIIEAQLPTGQTIELEVPDNWSDAQIGAEVDAIAAQQAPAAQPGPLAGKSAFETGIIGMGRGMSNVVRQVGSMLGMVSPEEMEMYHQLDQPLMETTAGKVGSIAGEVAALAPVAGGAVGMGGKALTTAVPALRGAAAARPVATAMGTGAAEGALEGAVVGGPGQRARGAATGAIAGGLTGGVLPLVAHGLIRPTPEAQRLLDMGVDLTPGELRPGGPINLVQQAAQSIPGMGPSGRTQRETAEGFIQAGAPPGVTLTKKGNLNEMLAEAYEAYKPAYGTLNEVPVNQQIRQQLKAGFARAVDDAEVLAGDEQRKAVQRFLDNQVSRLTKAKLKAGDILSVRSRIRSKISDAKRAQKWEEAELLGNAEALLTEQLNRGMPAKAADYNRLLDLQYSKYKVAEDALYRMGDREFPTPYQWSLAQKKGTPKGAYARGAGRLRPEVEAASNVFRTVSPPTGARLATLAAGGGLGWGAYSLLDPTLLTGMGVAAIPLIGTRAGRQFSAGMAPWQPGFQQLLRQYQLATGAFPRGTAAIMAAEQQ